MIDLSPMKGIRVDPVRRTAQAEAGLRLGEFDYETQAFGLATPLGVNPDGRDAIRGGEQQRKGGHFIRAGARKFIVESKDILCLCHGVKYQAPQHWAYRMQLIVKRSDDAKIGPRATHAPE